MSSSRFKPDWHGITLPVAGEIRKFLHLNRDHDEWNIFDAAVDDEDPPKAPLLLLRAATAGSSDVPSAIQLGVALVGVHDQLRWSPAFLL
jgi:hypothetical protein